VNKAIHSWCFLNPVGRQCPKDIVFGGILLFGVDDDQRSSRNFSRGEIFMDCSSWKRSLQA